MRRLAPLAALLALTTSLAGCQLIGGDEPATETIQVLAGSELRDVEPLLAEAAEATGVKLELEYVGTLEGAERIAAGDGTPLAWFSSDRYLRLLGEDGAVQPVASTRIMVSPVVLGVRRSLADRFGWTGSDEVTWKDVADRVAAGELRYGMTNPAASNSGFSALLGVAAALAGTGDALQRGEVDADRLTEFFSGQALTAGSSGFLADAYVADQDRLDGLINYESVLLELNQGGRLKDPLELIYPREGIVTADYPLLLLDPAKREAYDRVTSWLRSPEVQRRLMTTTHRRPAVPEVRPDESFPDRTLVELAFPADRAVTDQLILSYLDRFRRPTHAIFVLDVSDSMTGQRLDDLKRSLTGLTGADDSLSGRFSRFRAREKITVITFNHLVKDEEQVTVEAATPNDPALAAVRTRVEGLAASGGTAIWSALGRAYDRVEADLDADREFLTTIVLMSDGENTHGTTLDEFLADHAARPAPVRAVRTFAIRFGEADPAELERAATATGGAVFDAGERSLADVFKDIRGYQ